MISEGEHIRVVVVPIEKIENYFADAKVVIAYGLYSRQKTSQ